MVLSMWIICLAKSFKEKITNKTIIYVGLLITAFVGLFASWLALDMLFFDDFFYFITMFLLLRTYMIKRLNEEE